MRCVFESSVKDECFVRAMWAGVHNVHDEMMKVVRFFKFLCCLVDFFLTAKG